MSRREDGFTLIEVLVALAILAVSLGVLLQVISSVLERTRESRNDAAAVALVQSLMARVGTEMPVAEGDRDGDYSNGFHWHVHMERFGNAEDRKAGPAPAYAVRATVSWKDGTQPHAKTLSTLRITAP